MHSIPLFIERDQTLIDDLILQITLSSATHTMKPLALGWHWLVVGKVAMNARPTTLMALNLTMVRRIVNGGTDKSILVMRTMSKAVSKFERSCVELMSLSYNGRNLRGEYPKTRQSSTPVIQGAFLI